MKHHRVRTNDNREEAKTQFGFKRVRDHTYGGNRSNEKQQGCKEATDTLVVTYVTQGLSDVHTLPAHRTRSLCERTSSIQNGELAVRLL